MLRIRRKLYADSQRIQNAVQIGALENANDKWKPSQNFFQRHPAFRPIDSLARLKQHLMTDQMNFFKRTYAELLETHSPVIFPALGVKSLDFHIAVLHSEVWA